MTTNPIGKGTKTIGINMNAKLADELEKRAAFMYISLSKYCKLILSQLGRFRKKAQARRTLAPALLLRTILSRT